MGSSESNATEGEFFGGRREQTALGVAYVLVGVGFFSALLTESMAVFRGVLVAILALVAFSLYVLYRREGVASSENVLTGVCVLVAMTLLFVLSAYTDLPSMVVFVVVVVVGVLVPGMLVQYVESEPAE